MSIEHSVQPSALHGRRLALVIGVNASESPILVPLQFAERDAERMAEILQTQCDFELFRPPFLGHEASTDTVRSAILKLAQQAKEDDALLFYFSGHAQPMTIEAGMQATYLVTANFDEQIAEVDNTAYLSLAWLREKLLLGTKAERVLIVLDSCFSEDIRTPPDRYLEELRQRIAYYFEMPGSNDGTRRSGLRVALAAASYDQTTGERDGSGIMTGLLLQALSGKVDAVLGDDGSITLNRLTEYIKEAMPQQQKPAISTSDTGGYEYILAHYPERATELLRQRQRTPVVNERPHTYIPLPHKDSFQPRPKEFETLEHLLLPPPTDTPSSPRVALVGVLGMGGIGKTQLAAEFAHRYKERFAAGVFWMPAIGTTLADWQHQFADLAEKTDYLRANDDITHPENETKRARHLCRYLAQHPDALLILDNVENTDLVQTVLPTLAGEEAHCTLLYTSRNTMTSSGVKKHIVERLPVEGALNLLLTHRPALLPNALIENTSDVEAQAARAICRYLDYLPLALTLLRDLLQDEYLTLTHLSEQLQQRGAFEITQSDDESEARLFSTFHLSWDKIRDAGAQRLFKLAAYFPEATAIPLWLLGLAAGLGETGNTALESLGRARLQLQKWSVIEVLADQQIRLHPLLREFGRRLVDEDEQKNTLLQEAGQRLIGEFTDINKLEKRALEKGYWSCLEQVQAAYQYAQILNADNIEQLERIERWLARDSSLLSTDSLWPERMPGLFYQLLYNHMLEAGYQPTLSKQSRLWVRQLEWVGIEDDLLFREFEHPDSVTCVAYSPDCRTIATGCEDSVARLWDVTSGQTLVEFCEHTDHVLCLAFSPNGTTIATGSDDATTRVWDVTNGEQLHLLRGSTQAVRSVAFSSNGTRIVTVSEDGIVRVWDIASEEQIAIFSEQNIRLRQAVFTHDGKRVVSCSEFGAYTWDISKERIVQRMEEKAVRWTLVMEANLLISGYSDIVSVEVAIREEHLYKTKIVNIEYETVTKIARRNYMVESSTVVAPSVSSNQEKFALPYDDKVVEIWNIHNKATYLTSLNHVGRVTSLAFSPDETYIVTGAEDKKVRLWRIPLIPNTNVDKTSLSQIATIAFSNDGTQLAVKILLDIQLWNISKRTVAKTIYFRSGLCHMEFSPKDKFLLTCARNYISIIDIENEKTRDINEDFTGAIFIDDLYHMTCFSPDGNTIANDISTISSYNIQIRRVIDGKVIAKLKGHRSEINHLAFSPDGTRLVSGSMDGTARIWNMEDYSTVAILKNHVGGVTCLCISPDSKLVATGSLDGVVHIWSMQDGKELALLKRQRVAPSSMAFSPDGSLLLVNDRYAYTSLWKMDAQSNGQIVGMYTTATEVKALHWQNVRNVLLVAIDASGYKPQIYHLALEGEW